MKTRLSVIICVQVGEIINGMTQNGLIVFHFRQIQKLDRLKERLSGLNIKDWKTRPWKEIFRQHKYCLERKRKENTPAQSARVQTVRDSDGTSIQSKNSILEYYVTSGVPQTWQKSNYCFSEAPASKNRFPIGRD